MTQPDHLLLPDSPYETYGDHLARYGRDAFVDALARPPEELLAEVLRSGLRGRGGAGFPTGVKWRTVRAHPCTTKVVVCNAAEGEPGTFKDRTLLRRNPYLALEGMLIAARVVGASQLYVGIKASFPREIARLQQAWEELQAEGLIDGIDLTIVEGPDEYLFGEEKALLNVLEGGMPMPREAHYPPYEWGVDATPASPNPAVVNNVETFAHVATIARFGGASFRELGSDDTPGTILFTISGDVRRPGVYEREAGISLRELLEEVAGGPREGRRFQAVLSGVSNPVLPASKLDVAADFGSLALARFGLGSAGLMVLDDSRSMARVAQAAARFLAVETCNQCTSCMHGLRTASKNLDRLFLDEGEAEELAARAVDAALAAPHQNRCYLPVQGSILIPSLIETFSDQFQGGAAALDPEGETYLLPKIVDFDEEAGRFVYDHYQPFKQFDWTYDVPPDFDAAEAEAARREVPPLPPAPAAGPVHLTLRGDLAAQLLALAEGRGLEVDELARSALEGWVREQG
jgi:NADH:ubiquinone oxidoreductase subunit F (NADH-binding)